MASVKVNSAVNAVGFVFVTGSNFLLTPITFSKLGKVEYGVWVFIISTLSYTSILYLGFGSAIIKYVATYFEQNKIEKINSLVGTLLGIYLILGFLTFFVSALIAWFLPSMIEIESDATNYRLAILLVGFQLALAFPFNVFGGILIAMQRFILISVARILTAFINVVGILMIPKEAASVSHFALVFFFATGTELLIYSWENVPLPNDSSEFAILGSEGVERALDIQHQ